MTFSLASLKAAARLLTAAACTFLFIISASGFQVLYAQEPIPTPGAPTSPGGLVRLTGNVTDKDSGEELIGVSVSIVGTRTGASTNVDGVFNIQVAPGTYDVRATYIGYKPKTVKGVVVASAGPNRVDFNLEVEGVTAQEIVVEATQSNATEGALLTQQRKATTVQDAISAELIRRTPDSDAGEAAKRITGVTLVGGKFVFVRGLGERYSSTQLNGITIPSPEPEKKVVPFDIIPASLIENIVTIKTFQPDQPGAFGGGLVRIKTREFPDQFQLNIGTAVGFNSRSHFTDILRYNGSSTDFLGIDDGLRKLPDGVINYGNGATRPQQAEALSKFTAKNWLPFFATSGPNQSYSASLADQINLGSVPLGYIASITYGNDVTFRDQRLFFPNNDATNPTPLYRYGQAASTYTVNWGGVLNFAARLGENNKFSLNNTYNRSAEDETRIATGSAVESGTDVQLRSTRLRYVEKELLSTQLSGNHYLSFLAKSELEWKLQYATAKRNEPDNRETLYQKFFIDPDSLYAPASAGNRNSRFFSTLGDFERDALLDWSFPFRQWSNLNSKLKIGGLYTSKNRSFVARRFAFSNFAGNTLVGVSPDSAFTTDRVTNRNLSFLENTQPTDRYEAEERLSAGYVMVELPVTSQLRFIGGARVEKDFVKVDARNGNGVPVSGGFDVTNVLPSVNFIYSLGEAMNFRASFSQTVAQPEFRELAPFRFDDYRSQTIGNPYLVQSRIVNYDLRWEWFPRLGELFAVSFFYKTIADPLEKAVTANVGSVPLTTTINASDKATNFGAEFEVRRKLDFISSTFKDFSASVNFTLVSSEIISFVFPVTVKPNGERETSVPFPQRIRPLQGQSPYVVNANIGYTNEAWGFSGIILYNISGRRISELAGDFNFAYDFYEESRNQLDLSINKTFLNNKLTAKLNFRNIIDDRYLFTFGPDASDLYNVGRSFSLSVSYSL